jgi:plasmid stabilization system protein ParE
VEISVYRVIVSKRAAEALKAIYLHLDENVSEEFAERVKDALLQLSLSLQIHPRRFPREHWIQQSGAEIRSTVSYNYKIIYEIKGDEVRILNFYHTKRNPKEML